MMVSPGRACSSAFCRLPPPASSITEPLRTIWPLLCQRRITATPAVAMTTATSTIESKDEVRITILCRLFRASPEDCYSFGFRNIGFDSEVSLMAQPRFEHEDVPELIWRSTLLRRRG